MNPIRITRAAPAILATALALTAATPLLALDLPKLPKPPTPELPSVSLSDVLSVLPDGVQMPEPGQMGAAVSCLQQGNMDIARPSLPLLSCWESATTGTDGAQDLQKACTVQMTPMKIDSQLVPKCPSKALGTCIGARSGGSAGSATSLSNHYHYTPQTLGDWIKSKENCERSNGKWYGLGNSFGLF